MAISVELPICTVVETRRDVRGTVKGMVEFLHGDFVCQDGKFGGWMVTVAGKWKGDCFSKLGTVEGVR